MLTNYFAQYPIAVTALMLTASNLFMTFSWYGLSTANRGGSPRW